jgi:predicted HicB family RNase H-like nuclease
VSTQLHVRIPAEEKEQLRAEAQQHGISMSALVRINNIAARQAREREAMKRRMYPDKPSDV